MFSVVCSCEGKVLGTDLNERPTAYYIAFYCLLYCILLSTGFTVRKLYYVSILFYYASVFDFPKYKKLYIALFYGRKNTSFLEVLEFRRQDKSEIGIILFPAVNQTASKWQKQETTLEIKVLFGKMKEFVLIFQHHSKAILFPPLPKREKELKQ